MYIWTLFQFWSPYSDPKCILFSFFFLRSFWWMFPNRIFSWDLEIKLLCFFEEQNYRNIVNIKLVAIYRDNVSSGFLETHFMLPTPQKIFSWEFYYLKRWSFNNYVTLNFWTLTYCNPRYIHIYVRILKLEYINVQKNICVT